MLIGFLIFFGLIFVLGDAPIIGLLLLGLAILAGAAS